MQKVSLKFSDDGKQVVINYGKQKTTDFFESKLETVDAAEALKKKGDITEEDFKQIVWQLTEAENLPWSSEKSEKGHIFSIGIKIGLGAMLLDSLSSLFGEDDTPENPSFVACKACGEHGRIYTKEGMSNTLWSKKHARQWLEDCGEKVKLSEEDLVKIKGQIEESTLPEEKEGK